MRATVERAAIPAGIQAHDKFSRSCVPGHELCVYADGVVQCPQKGFRLINGK